MCVTIKQKICLLGAGLDRQALQQEVENALAFIWPLPQHVLEQKTVKLVDRSPTACIRCHLQGHRLWLCSMGATVKSHALSLKGALQCSRWQNPSCKCVCNP